MGTEPFEACAAKLAVLLLVTGLCGCKAGDGDNLARDFDKFDGALRHLASHEPRTGDGNVRSAWDDLGDHIVIDVTTKDNPQELLSSLEALGLVGGAFFGPVVSGIFPSNNLDQLAALPSVHFARLAARTRNAGSVTSQGDAAQQTDVVRSGFGITGTNAIIGTMSDSYNCQGGAAGDVTSGDLPAGVVVLQDEIGCGNGSDEGRAMMQIVHDVAPGSTQKFNSAFNGTASFASGIVALKDAGAKVIVDDVIYYGEPMFQDGIIAQAVNQVTAAGVSFFSAAGNFGRNAYEHSFVATGMTPAGGGEVAHDWDPGAGTDVFLNFTVTGPFAIVLQWDSPSFSATGLSGATNDLNLYVFNNAASSIVLSSTDLNPTHDPFEMVQGFAASATSFNVVVTKKSGAAPSLMRLIFDGNLTINEFSTSSPTLYGHTNAAGAIAVGAAFYVETPEFGTTPPLLEAYSSAGNTPILFNGADQPVSISRNHPDVTAPDGVNTTFFGQDFEPNGFKNFFGTSAAAPHAAALAGLLLSFDNTFTTSEIKNLLVGNCINIGPAGYDFDSGNGLIDASAVFADALEASIQATITPTPASVAEPGASVSLDVAVQNLGNASVSLTSLSVAGQGTCSVPQTIAVGASYTCSFSSSVSGQPGTANFSVSASGTTTLSTAVSDSDQTSVMISDVLPTGTVLRTAAPTSVTEPGAPVTFTVRVDNTSAAESLSLTALSDSTDGDLDGQGSCAVPQTIASGGFYQCAYTAMVSGAGGTMHTSTTTATLGDNESNTATPSDGETVMILTGSGTTTTGGATTGSATTGSATTGGTDTGGTTGSSGGGGCSAPSQSGGALLLLLAICSVHAVGPRRRKRRS